MAGVAKRLRQWIVTPSFAGSIPVIRPKYLQQNKLYIKNKKNNIVK